MLVCQNQPCGARWSPAEVTIKNEGQGPMFRCPLCGARNALRVSQRSDGTVRYEQVRRDAPVVEGQPRRGRRRP